MIMSLFSLSGKKYFLLYVLRINKVVFNICLSWIVIDLLWLYWSRAYWPILNALLNRIQGWVFTRQPFAMCRHRQAVVIDIHLIHSELFNKFNIIYFLPILDTTYWNIGLVLLNEKYLMATSEINFLANLFYPSDLWYSASIKPRLLFSRAGYASWGLSLSSVFLLRFHRGLRLPSKLFVLFIKQ